MKVLITGITGHVGSYLAELLLSKGYIVHGLVRRTSNFTTNRIDHIFSRLYLHYGDMTDQMSLIKVLKTIEPDCVYNLAAQSHVKVSDDLESFTMDTNTLGVLNLIQAIKLVNPEIRMVQASTSEMYGNASESDFLNEMSEFRPVSVYGISKLSAYHLVRYYREAFGMFLCNSIGFNHESERRGRTFVTRKISEYVKGGSYESPLRLGNLDACRDWSHTEDIVRGMCLMLEYEKADDYVLASGETHSVREYTTLAFKLVGITLEWIGEGLDECGVDMQTKKVLVVVDLKYYRPIDIKVLKGDSRKARDVLGWKPNVTFESLVRRMTIGNRK